VDLETTIKSNPGVHDDDDDDDDDDDHDDMYRFPAARLPDSFFNPEDGGRTFLENICEYP
jgi:hypothetical protein